MQISKRLNLICAAAAAVLPLTALAADNAAQIKARQALEQLYNQSGAQPAAAPAPSSPAAVQSTPAQPPAPVVQSAAPSRADSDRIAKAREALRQKMAEIESQPAASAPALTPVAPAPAPVQVTPSRSAVVTAAPAPAPAAKDPQSIERAREALRKKMAELDQPAGTSAPAVQVPAQAQVPALVAPAQAAPQAQFSDLPSGQTDAQAEKARQALRKSMEATAQQPAVAKEAPAKPVKPAPVAKEAPAKPEKSAVVQAPAERKAQPQKSPEKRTVAQQPRQYEPLQGPPLPFTQEQQAKLAELLRKYRADEITPDQYHAERAKIVGQAKK